jgi:hypothetical protein
LSTIPYEKYFTLDIGVFDPGGSARRLVDVQLRVVAGMAHGLREGFAHTIQSAPKIEIRDGIAAVSGMYLHMRGAWTMEVTVRREGRAYFALYYAFGPVEAQLNVRNLFDTRYFTGSYDDVYVLPGAPRTFSMDVTWHP